MNRTVVLPSKQGNASSIPLPGRNIHDNLMYTVELNAWLADAADQLISVEVEVNPLSLLEVKFIGYLNVLGPPYTGWTFELTKGVAGVTDVVRFYAHMLSKETLTVDLSIATFPDVGTNFVTLNPLNPLYAYRSTISTEPYSVDGSVYTIGTPPA